MFQSLILKGTNVYFLDILGLLDQVLELLFTVALTTGAQDPNLEQSAEQAPGGSPGQLPQDKGLHWVKRLPQVHCEGKLANAVDSGLRLAGHRGCSRAMRASQFTSLSRGACFLLLLSLLRTMPIPSACSGSHSFTVRQRTLPPTSSIAVFWCPLLEP